MKFSVTRVVTKDIVTDAFQGIRNLFGLRLRGYEKMLNKHIKEAIEFAEVQYKIEWWKLIVNPLTNGSAMIIVYGEGEKNE
ncbi:hypothetical protein LCGC14_0979930 [marine sediment metagenome]|uniref:Uncharacterized protein n=1 Tax=marine sediment metagenome TaxID=412755 RepID=A0A0F9QSC6_9ZZZZ